MHIFNNNLHSFHFFFVFKSGVFPYSYFNSKQGHVEELWRSFPSIAENVNVGNVLNLLLRQRNSLHLAVHQPFEP